MSGNGASPAWALELAPTHEGPAGKAWRIEEAGAGGDPEDPRREVFLGGWMLYAPGAHPFWSWHVLLGVALRPLPGLPPPHLRYPGAEYELMVWALHPDKPVPDPRAWGEREDGLLLQPADAVVQFHDVPDGDAGATALLDLCARAVAHGLLVPDSDHRASWERTVAGTLDHVRSGAHGWDL